MTAGKVRGDASVQYYSGRALIESINGTVSQRSCDVQY